MKRNVIIGVLVLCIGIILSIVFLVIAFTNLFGESIKFTTPNALEVQLEEGSYTVNYEYESTVEGHVFSTTSEDLDGMNLTVISEDGQRVNVGPSKGNSSYTINNRKGYSILSFDITRLGNYHIITEHDKEIVINITKVEFLTFVKYLLSALITFVLSILLALFALTRKPKVIDDY